MATPATTVTIIAERLLQSKIVRLLEETGASGYTVVEGSGKGHHLTRTHERPSLVRDFDIVRIEFVMTDGEHAREIAQQIADTFFKEYSGIIYISPVEVLRPELF
ncbi:P-II family nitrogen regulator [Altererythrobacter sp. GH1-8]|uniref:P-II family nitrogen regulator n=1 Tax=Altererythrobacter sp. GH1-8 TaxID=3349333 RepID=UPI00374CD006